MTKNIYVCVGSSCHLKGSYDIIQRFKALIEESHADVTINASFCLGHCADGVSVKVDDMLYTGVTPDNADAFFAEHVLA